MFFMKVCLFRIGQKTFPSRLLPTNCLVLKLCQKHAVHPHSTADLPHSDYPFKFFDNFHSKITPLVLKIPVQWNVTFLEFFDQSW